MPRIGYLSPGPRELYADRIDAFLAQLRELGYVEGETIAIDWRFAPADSDADNTRIAAELVRLPVDVIVTYTTPPTRAAMQATDRIPIIFIGVANPLETGLVASLNVPGGNVTGVDTFPPGFEAKMVDLLREAVPGLRRIAAIVDPRNAGNVTGWNVMRKAAEQQAAFDLERIDLPSTAAIEAAFDAAVQSGAEAIIDTATPLVTPIAAQYAELALRHRLPGMSIAPQLVEAGLLMQYAPNVPANWRHAAVYVDKVLKGRQPADLPVEQPTVFDLVVNVKTQQALGITIPSNVASQVTEWISETSRRPRGPTQ
jgi:putative ABC transport system substrate-binding protein